MANGKHDKGRSDAGASDSRSAGHTVTQKPPAAAAGVEQSGTGIQQPQPEQATQAATGTDVATAANTSVMVVDYGDDAGRGMENLERDEFRIPLIRIIQKGSPQCRPVAQGGVEGAVAGIIFNTSTGEMWPGDPGMVFIPVYRDHNYVEYVPRDAGGGFVGLHPPASELVKSLRDIQGRFGKLTTKDGTEIVETYYLYGLLLAGAEVRQVVLPFVSKQIAKYQNLMQRYIDITYPNDKGERVRPPLWAHRWHLSTKFESNKKGDWYGWVLRLEKMTPLECRMALNDPLYVQARSFFKLLEAGSAKAAHAADAKAGAAGADGDEEMPF